MQPKFLKLFRTFIVGTPDHSKRTVAFAQIVKLLKLYSRLASKYVSSVITQSPSLASPNHATPPYFELYAESMDHFQFKQLLLIHVLGAFICQTIVCNAVSLIQIFCVILSQISFERYNERKSPTENAWLHCHCCFVSSFMIQTANHLVTVNVSVDFAVIFTISLFMQTPSS